MCKWTARWMAVGVWALLTAGAAAQDDAPDFDEILQDKGEVLKREKDAAEAGDMKKFTVVTDTNIDDLEVGAEYKTNASFFEVIEIKSQGTAGGKFVVKRTGGTADPGRRWTRVLGKGPPSIETRETLLDRFLSGGVLMYPIAFLLLIAIIIAINSLWVYRRTKQCPARFVESAREAIAERDIEKFRGLAEGQKGLFASICRAMTTNFHTSTEEDIRTRCETEALRQVSRLRTPLKGLNFIASVAPLLGLLGTVIGMITCFESVADWGDTPGKSQRMAGGIKEALLTTAGGLSVAVPSLFVFFVFSQKLNLIVADCEGLATEFVHDLVRAEQSQSSPRRKPSRRRRKRPPPEPADNEPPGAGPQDDQAEERS